MDWLRSLQVALRSFKSECGRARVCSPANVSVGGQERARSGLSYKVRPIVASVGRLTVSSQCLLQSEESVLSRGDDGKQQNCFRFYCPEGWSFLQ